MLAITLGGFPFKVTKNIIRVMPIYMIYFKSTSSKILKMLWDRNKGSGYKDMYSNSSDLPISVQLESWPTILIREGCKYSIDDSSPDLETSYLSKVRNLIKTLVSYDREPTFFHFLRLAYAQNLSRSK
jgi:hypothetical protein